MLSALEAATPGVAEALRQDALATVDGWGEPAIRMVVDASTTTDDCSVAGGYRGDTDPPTIIVARSASRRRQQFTALHEIGHHIQRNDIELLRTLHAATDPEELEEASCDAFAGRVLLPDTVVNPLIGPRGPTADDVVTLYSASQASRAACCVRTAEHLTSPGTVFLLNQDGIVDFSIGHGMAPPARGSDQSGTPVVAAALRAKGTSRRDTHIAYRNGSTSDLLYGDCAAIDGWMVAIAVLDRAAWQPFAPPRPHTGTLAPSRWWTCEYCNDDFDSVGSTRCDQCGQPTCPAGHCGCTLHAERTCTECWLTKHRSQFSAAGTVCRECRGE